MARGFWKDLSPSLSRIWVCPQWGNSVWSFLPFRWMEGKGRQAKEGGGGGAQGRQGEEGVRGERGKRRRW